MSVRILPLAACAATLVPHAAVANEWDDAVSRTLVVPALLYEQREKKHRECITEHMKEERLASLSQLVVSSRELVTQTRANAEQYRLRRERGENVDTLAEANTLRWLPQYEKSLNDNWVGYKNVGGTAERIESVVKIEGPCGPVPQRPRY